MGNCCTVDIDELERNLKPNLLGFFFYLGCFIFLALFLKVSLGWFLVVRLGFLALLYETDNLSVFSRKSLSGLSARLYRISPVLGGFIYKQANKLAILVLVLSNTAIILYIMLVFARRAVKKYHNQEFQVPCVSKPTDRISAVLFSGGTDSTNAVLYAAKRSDIIHLVTYNRLGFYNMGASTVNANRLKNTLKNKRIVHRIINMDEFYKQICYENYFFDLINYGLMLLLTCGLCKLAMHWCMILYCMDNNIQTVYDGANSEMLDPSQAKDVIIEMKKLYRQFGIKYSSPVYYQNRNERERRLYDMGLSEKLRVKWSDESSKIEPYCTQEQLFIDYVNYSIYRVYEHDVKSFYARYTNRMLKFHRKKRSFVVDRINKYLNGNIPNYSNGKYYAKEI